LVEDPGSTLVIGPAGTAEVMPWQHYRDVEMKRQSQRPLTLSSLRDTPLP